MALPAFNFEVATKRRAFLRSCPHPSARSLTALARGLDPDRYVSVLRATGIAAVSTRILVDDVLGCVDPVGSGGDIAKARRRSPPITATMRRDPDHRFTSGLDAVNFAAAQVMQASTILTAGGGVESMSRVGLGYLAGLVDPPCDQILFHATRNSVDLIAIKAGFSSTMSINTWRRNNARRKLSARAAKNSVPKCAGHQWRRLLDRDEHMRLDRYAVARRAETSFAMMGEQVDLMRALATPIPKWKRLCMFTAGTIGHCRWRGGSSHRLG